jgi:predicted nucleic acid-binding protein
VAVTLYLVDKSAFEQQRHHEQAAETLTALAADNRLATCEIIALELLYSTRGRRTTRADGPPSKRLCGCPSIRR